MPASKAEALTPAQLAAHKIGIDAGAQWIDGSRVESLVWVSGRCYALVILRGRLRWLDLIDLGTRMHGSTPVWRFADPNNGAISTLHIDAVLRTRYARELREPPPTRLEVEAAIFKRNG